MKKIKQNKPKVIFFGSKPGSVVALSILLKRKWNVEYVIPSKHITDKLYLHTTLKEIAINNNIPVLKQNEIPLNKEVDYIISYMYRYKIKNECLLLAKKSAINFHPHPLPEYSGYGGYNIAILENKGEFGCTCHHMIEEFDAGPIVKINRFSINSKEETAYSLEQKTQQEMIRLFIDFCKISEAKEELPSITQNKQKKKIDV